MTLHPKKEWFPKVEGVRMRDARLPNGKPQPLYFSKRHPDRSLRGHFKGMQKILKERKMWRDGLKAECTGFKCAGGTAASNCCARRILFNEPDFVGQKSSLEELFESRGHICDFYPKFHCELNFIEQYWGAAKREYRLTPVTKTASEMEANVIKCLDSVQQEQITR